MVVERGDVWWADLGEPEGSGPGFRRPVLIVQADAFNRSQLQTVIAVVLTSNLRLVDAPGNVLMPAKATDLPKDSVANVSQVITVDREFLTEKVGRLRGQLLKDVDNGLRFGLSPIASIKLSNGEVSAAAAHDDASRRGRKPMLAGPIGVVRLVPA